MRDREKFSTKIGKQKPPAHSCSECGPARPEKKIENDVKTSLWAVVVIGLSFHAKILEDGILTCAKSWHCSLKAKVFARNAFAYRSDYDICLTCNTGTTINYYTTLNDMSQRVDIFF